MCRLSASRSQAPSTVPYCHVLIISKALSDSLFSMAKRAAAWWDSQGSARPLLANVICFLSIQVPCCCQNNASQIPWKCLMLFCLCIKSKNPFTWTAAHSPKSRGSILFTINTYPTFSRRNMFPFQDTRHLFVSVLGNYYTSLVICPHILSLCISSDIT